MYFRSTFLRSLLSLILAAAISGPIALASFPDVSKSHPEAEYIEKLQEIYAISGFEDNGFHPEVPITRAGVIKVAMQASNHVAVVIDSDYRLSYKDLKTEDPITGYIEAAVKLGILSGDGTTNFRPDDPATRAEGLKIVLSAFDIKPPEVEKTSYSDINDDDWYKPYAEFAHRFNLIRTNGTLFLPNNPLKRSELARIVAKIYNAKDEEPVKNLPMGPIIVMSILWLLFATPLVIYVFRHIKKVWLKSLLLLVAIALGPIGSLALSLMQIFTTRVSVSGGDAAPKPNRKRALRRFSFSISRRNARLATAWIDQVQLKALSAILSIGYLVVLIELISTSVATMQSREELAIFLNG